MKVRGALSFILFAAFATSYIIGQDAPKQETARTVQYHAQDIVPIHAKMNFTTLLVLPSSEEVIDAATGDKEFWIVDVVQNFVFVHPAKEHIESNLNLITNKGNVYSFTLTDVSGTATPVDLKVIIQTTDLSSIIPMSTQERFVPAEQMAAAGYGQYLPQLGLPAPEPAPKPMTHSAARRVRSKPPGRRCARGGRPPEVGERPKQAAAPGGGAVRRAPLERGASGGRRAARPAVRVVRPTTRPVPQCARGVPAVAAPRGERSVLGARYVANVRLARTHFEDPSLNHTQVAEVRAPDAHLQCATGINSG